MYRQLIIWAFISAFLHSVQSGAQQVNLPQVDAATYVAWQKGDWNELIRIGNEALENGIDFYYLRVRMGIAWYEKENYHAALPHFEKAYVRNQQEDFLKEYLYYTYRFTDRWSEAALLARDFSPSLKSKTQTDHTPFVTALDLFYGYTALSDNAVTEEYTNSVDLTENGSQYIPQKLNSYYIGLQHRLAPRFMLYHAFTGLQINHFRYSQAEGKSKTDYDFNTSTLQYYLSGNIAFSKNLNMLMGAHFINVRYPIETEYFRQGNYYTITTTYTDNDLVAFASLYQRFRYATVGVGFYYGTLNYTTQYQRDIKLVLFPLGNKNLYTNSLVSYQTQKTSDGIALDQFIVDQQIGVKVARSIWVEAYGTWGDIENFMLNDGALVYNRLDLIRNRYGGRVIVFPTPTWSIHLEYGYTSALSSFVTSESVPQFYNTVTYRQYSLNARVSWKF